MPKRIEHVAVKVTEKNRSNYMTIKETALFLELTPRQVRNLMGRGDLVKHKDGKRLYFSRKEVEGLTSSDKKEEPVKEEKKLSKKEMAMHAAAKALEQTGSTAARAAYREVMGCSWNDARLAVDAIMDSLKDNTAQKFGFAIPEGMDSFNQYHAQNLILAINQLNAHGKTAAKKAIGGSAKEAQAIVNQLVEATGWKRGKEVPVPTMKQLTGKTDEEWNREREEIRVKHSVSEIKRNIYKKKADLIDTLYRVARDCENQAISIEEVLNDPDGHVPSHPPVGSLWNDVVSLTGALYFAQQQWHLAEFVIRQLGGKEEEKEEEPQVPTDVAAWILERFDNRTVATQYRYFTKMSDDNKKAVIEKMLSGKEDKDSFWECGCRGQYLRFRNAVDVVVVELIKFK